MKVFSRSLGVSTIALAIALGATAPAKADGKKTIGLTLTAYDLANPGAGEEECPEGYQYTTAENWEAMFPDKAVRDKLGRWNETFGAPDHRGPNGESMTFRPWVLKDPLPLREVQSKVAFGVNLDGTKDGQATAKTCAHPKFSSVDGKATDIDNQLYRVSACWKGMRKGGHPREFFATKDLIEINNNRFLIEITDVDDEMNDDKVNVTFYKGMDKVVRDADMKPIPWLSLRVDRRDPDYTQHTTGKIVNGELITDSMPVFTRPFVHIYFATGEYETKDMRLKLKLGPERATGIMSGYFDLWNWYFMHAKAARIGAGGWAPSSVWAGLVKHADGYKDPTTGQCTAISSAYAVEAVRAYIVKDGDKPSTTAESGGEEVKAAQVAP